MRRFVSMVVLCFVAFVNSARSGPVVDYSELDRLIPAELKEKHTPGAVITVISGDTIVYQKAFGVANVETNAPMQTEMLFRLGSTTKMFTALMNDGQVDGKQPLAATSFSFTPGFSPVI